MNIFPFTADGIANALTHPMTEDQFRQTRTEEAGYEIEISLNSEGLLKKVSQMVLESMIELYEKSDKQLPKSVGYFYKALRFWPTKPPVDFPEGGIVTRPTDGEFIMPPRHNR